MKVIAILPFDDLQEGVSREAGDSFEVTEERFEEINSTEFGQLVKPAGKEGQATARKPAARKATARKPASKRTAKEE